MPIRGGRILGQITDFYEAHGGESNSQERSASDVFSLLALMMVSAFVALVAGYQARPGNLHGDGGYERD